MAGRHASETLQECADRLAAVIKAEHAGEDVTVTGDGAHAGVHVRWDSPDKLAVWLEGERPPRKRTVRRWVKAFWPEPEYRSVEWTTEGSVVTCRRGAESQ